ncbi:hypothetical protein MASR2M66_02080 [Chloroflexota bacterium]
MIGSIMCAAPGLSAIILPGVGIPSVTLELSLFIGIVLLGVAAGAQADKIKARAINEKIIVFFILMFPLEGWDSR